MIVLYKYFFLKKEWLVFFVFFLRLFSFGLDILLDGWLIMQLVLRNRLFGVLREVWFLLFLSGQVWNKVRFSKSLKQMFVLIGVLFWKIQKKRNERSFYQHCCGGEVLFYDILQLNSFFWSSTFTLFIFWIFLFFWKEISKKKEEPEIENISSPVLSASSAEEFLVSFIAKMAEW